MPENPLDVLAKVDCPHTRHLSMCTQCAADAVRPELERLRAHVLDIAAHATPYGDIPNDPGYVGTYLLTAGALHRALGTIGHTAPSCQAEAERDEQARDRHRWRTRAEKAEAELYTLKAARRCPSCDHLTSRHQPDGCWYTVTSGTPGRDLVCSCEVAAPTPTEEIGRG